MFNLSSYVSVFFEVAVDWLTRKGRLSSDIVKFRVKLWATSLVQIILAWLLLWKQSLEKYAQAWSKETDII